LMSRRIDESIPEDLHSIVRDVPTPADVRGSAA
jgi:hypothetical protein